MSIDAIPDELLDRVQQLSAAVDELPDDRARELAQDLVSAVMAMYGDGLRRIMATIEDAREAGATILDQLAQDGAVSSLLLIHDLYPVPLEARVVEALDTVRPYMESHGGNVELLGIDDGVARLVLQGSCNGCAASRATLELAIKQALDEHAPDLAGLEVEGVADPGSNGALSVLGNGAGSAFELPVVHGGAELPMASGPTGPIPGGPLDSPPREPAARWVPLIAAARLRPGELSGFHVEGEHLLLANVDGALLAYRDECASCAAPITGGELHGSMLRCLQCSCEFDLRRAGRAAGNEPLQLTPVPLLEDGGVRVAL